MVGDAIEYSALLKTIATIASIDGTTGLASFVAADQTADQQMLAVEKALSLGELGAGHFAKWDNGGNTYLLIADGFTGSSVSAGDNLIKIVGVDSSHV